MKQPNDFLMFLKNKHCYSLFRRNFSSREIRNVYNDKDFIDALYDDNSPWSNSSLLGFAFSWGYSKEGHGFWNMICREMNKERKKEEEKCG